jgi:hypothetical protein
MLRISFKLVASDNVFDGGQNESKRLHNNTRQHDI